jgi:hypothetical protein
MPGWNCNLSGGHARRKHHLKLASFSNHATHFDAAMMFVFDSVLTCVAAMDLHISGLIFAFFASALLSST